MEDFIQNIRLRVEELPNHDVLKHFTSSLKNEEGIQHVEFEVRMFSIDFNPYVISQNEITHEMERLGIQPVFSEPKQNGIKRWLLNLAAQNKENLGSRRLDCCDMNH